MIDPGFTQSDWISAASGLVGALIGGGLSIGAAALGLKQQRNQAAEEASRAAATELLDVTALVFEQALAIILRWSDAATSGEVGPEPQAETELRRSAWTLALRLSDEALRDRWRDLQTARSLLTSFGSPRVPAGTVNARADELRSHAYAMTLALNAHIHGKALPPPRALPDVAKLTPIRSPGEWDMPPRRRG